MLEILEPGLQATVQDGGRPGLGHLGVPASGAVDRWALAVANLLVGNEPDAAAVEMTLGPARLAALTAARLGWAGGDLRATVEPGGRPVPPGSSVALAAGEVLAVAGSRPGAGLRAYVAVPGGIEVPVVLGSRSTCLAAGFGGLEGRLLRSGDRLAAAPGRGHARHAIPAPLDTWPGPAQAPMSRDAGGAIRLRILPGPLEPSLVRWLVSGEWLVEPSLDRMGVRLAPIGDPLPSGATGGDQGSHGVTIGTIQLPPDGRPIVLLPDHQPTGGYPVAGVVISADRDALGQLAPGDRIGFRLVDLRDARAAEVERRQGLVSAAAVAREGRRWAQLWQWAGG